MSDTTWPVAIIGSGNIGTDLMIKVACGSDRLVMGAMVGIDPGSDGLARGSPVGRADDGGRCRRPAWRCPNFDEIRLVVRRHVGDRPIWRRGRSSKRTGVRVLDLTPAAIGPYCVPVVNLDDHLDVPNLNMVTCGGQATVPIVAAVGQAAPVAYAEIVSSIASEVGRSGHPRQPR